MQCPKCGNENIEPASVCQVCSAPLTSTGPAPTWATAAADQPLTTQLYAAAIGPVHTGYYLNHFARFDHRGKAVLTWNWPACIATLGWMAFRRLWVEALIYLGLCVLASGLLLGALPLWLGHSESVLGGACAALVLLLCLPPAMLANGLYYKAINHHVTRALADSPDIATTQERLRHYASSRPRALGIAATVAALWLATASLAAWQWWSQAEAPTSVVASAPLLPASAPLRSAAYAPAPATSMASSAAASGSMPALAVPQVPASGQTAPAAPISATAPTLASASQPLTVAPPASAPPPPAAVSAVAPPASAAAPVRPTSVTKATPKSPTPLAAASGARPRHWVAAGLFAQAENAQKLRQQLLDLNLPVRADQVQSLRGEFTRVRVGPFETRAQAKAAQRQMEQAGIKAVLLKP